MAKKSVLGRGLGALIDNTLGGGVTDEPGGGGEQKYFLCHVDNIHPNRQQPRKTFREDSLAELSASIKEKGIIEPLIVTKTMENGFELIAGERRLRASKMAGLTEVPVVVLNVSDTESLELAIIENIQREDLNPLEEALAYQSLVDCGDSQEEVAKKVGRKRATVANFLRLLKLPKEAMDAVAGGEISMGHAKAILSLEGEAARRALLKRIITKGLSVRQTESAAKKTLSEKAGGAGDTGKKSAGKTRLTEVEESLLRVLGTKVEVTERGGKGRIEISYFTAEERERLLELLFSLK